MIYRVILKVSYAEAYFDFTTPDEAVLFAKVALEHSAPSEDQRKMVELSIKVINTSEEDKED